MFCWDLVQEPKQEITDAECYNQSSNKSVTSANGREGIEKAAIYSAGVGDMAYWDGACKRGKRKVNSLIPKMNI
jgi:hypothetical protein